MTSPVSQQLRRHVLNFMSALPLPAQSSDPESFQRTDGVMEFGLHWQLRGTPSEGVFASFSDRDDVIEFGLLERDGDVATNILHATIVLDDSDAQLNCMSEVNTEFNFDAYITPDKLDQLRASLAFFESAVRDVSH
uniref:hypothetical protein n=1 Tax=Pseudomonas syringae TaxID=317 RepID=UPI001E4CEB11|nr:hypothetical protein [Pseudomonas syringae]QOQ33452.1 hypothetical protein [Pseudomonas syringae pv. actinidiae]